MQIALFDLDHTLIPFDTGMAWTEYLIGRGLQPASKRDDYLGHVRQYAAGTLDLRAMQRAHVGALRAVTPHDLAAWLADFETHLGPLLPADMQALVAHHRDAGDLCAIVTATPHFLAQALATLFGIPHLLATRTEFDALGHVTGEIVGEPCFRAHKISHVQTWLAERGLSLADVQRSWFYSDSFNDLPLLEAVTDPVAVRPDSRLRAIAEARGWPIM